MPMLSVQWDNTFCKLKQNRQDCKSNVSYQNCAPTQLQLVSYTLRHCLGCQWYCHRWFS